MNFCCFYAMMEMEKSNNQNSLAPTVSLSIVAPSLDSSPTKTPNKNDAVIPIPIDQNEKTEVTFKTGTNSSHSSSSSSEEDELKPKIPDGGWGWVVVFASLVLSMIADGISFSFGLLFVEFLAEFNASNSVTSWIGSLFMAVPLLTGPIMSSLVDKYGCRSMTMLGGVVSALGFIISSKVNSVGIMYLTFGTLSGLGLGLCYVTAVVSIAFWFDKKRTLAVGLSAAGTGIGTFVFSPLTTYLINEFRWRGTTLILGGLFLNMCVCGALMVDPDWIIEQNKQNVKLTKSGKSSKTSLESISSANISNSIDINELKNLLKSGKDTEYLLQSLETSLKSQAEADDNKLKNVHNSVLNLPTFIRLNEKVPIEVLEQLSSNKKLYNIILENYPSLLLCRSTSDKGLNNLDQDASHIERIPNSLPEEHLAAQEPLLNNKNSKISESPPPRNASFPWLKQHLVEAQRPSYFKNIKIHRQSLIHRGAIFNTNKYRFKASSCPNIYRVSMLKLPKDDEVALGWAGDQAWMNITKTYAVCLVLCGISCAGIQFYSGNYIMLEISAGLFGLFLSSSFSFTPGILVELVPLDRFTVAYGLQLLCMGIGILLGPPYAGHLYDVTRNWDQTFYQASVWIVISGILVAIIPYTKNRKICCKGPVEKEVEGAKDNVIYSVVLVLLLVILFIICMYYTAECLL
ncbi:hypothetical protein NQ314_014149 [Rhamnusium bicolor]|uniref:Uncharacterized protein n=1 Tax=Rhamnusium bicolor TaxID=1586634 RepID=A0AAV8X3S4_9CUCU|nr:hypothetical protein NQ314_014149 [Rhamnusium bicolor]